MAKVKYNQRLGKRFWFFKRQKEWENEVLTTSIFVLSLLRNSTFLHSYQSNSSLLYDVENLLISALFPKILADYNSMSKMAKVSRQLTGICSRSVAYEILHTLDSSFPLLEFVTLAFKITISWTTTQLSIFFYLYNHTALRIDTLSSYYS